jgi:hypothetical protein
MENLIRHKMHLALMQEEVKMYFQSPTSSHAAVSALIASLPTRNLVPVEVCS